MEKHGRKDKGNAKTKRYLGPLGRTSMTSPDALRAYTSFSNQRARCNRNNHPAFKHYGGKGIKVEYDSRDFIGWWLAENERLKIKGEVQCSRLKHNENYKFGNIKLESKRENVAEMNQRKKGFCVSVTKDDTTDYFVSVREMCRYYGWYQSNIGKMIRRNLGKPFNHRGFTIAKEIKDE